jgi:hypothetical protein
MILVPARRGKRNTWKACALSHESIAMWQRKNLPCRRYTCTLVGVDIEVDIDVGIDVEMDIGMYMGIGCEHFVLLAASSAGRLRSGIDYRHRLGE